MTWITATREAARAEPKSAGRARRGRRRAAGPAAGRRGRRQQDTTQLRGLRFLVPNTPGGGYDVTARTAAKAFEEAEARPGAIEVFNLPGAGGTVGLGRTGQRERQRASWSCPWAWAWSAACSPTSSPATLADATPIARLTEETEVVVVGKDSPLRTMADLLAAWKADPAGTPVGGGSSPGGPDHLAPMLMAEAVGIVPRDVNYMAFDGGGELLAAVLGGKVALRGVRARRVRRADRGGRAAAARGDRVRACGRVSTHPRCARRAWTSSSPTGAASSPRPDLDEKGRAELIGAFAALHDTPEWRDALARNGWDDAFLPAEGFGAFLAQRGRAGGRRAARIGAGEVTTHRSHLVEGALRARRLRAARRDRAAGPGGQPARHGRGQPVRSARPARGAAGARRAAAGRWPCCSPSTCCAAGTARPRVARTSTSRCRPTSAPWACWPGC